MPPRDLALTFGHKLGLHVTAVPACLQCPHLCDSGPPGGDCGHVACYHDGESFLIDTRNGYEDMTYYCDCPLHVEQHARVFGQMGGTP